MCPVPLVKRGMFLMAGWHLIVLQNNMLETPEC